MYECYDEIIGLSPDECVCTAEDRPVNYNVSKSGIYLSELTPISSLLGSEECDRSVWDMAASAVASAVKLFVAESNALLGKRFKLKRTPASGQLLGERKSKRIVSPTKNYAQITLRSSPIRGGVMRLKEIGGVFEGAADVVVQLHNSVDGFMQDFTITTVANKLVTIPVNLELPQYSKYAHVLEYYLVYLFDANNRPKDTMIDCGCGSWKAVYNTAFPYFEGVGNHRRHPWAEYVMVGGRQINSLDELEDEVTSLPNKMYGLTVELDFYCKVDEVLCETALDFKGNPLALGMALAIQYKAASILADKILRSPLLNRENLVNRDQWEEEQLVWNDKFSEHVHHIVNEAQHTANDCFGCKSLIEMTRQGLYS